MGLTADELPVNLKELRAQILYRLENYEECFEAYENIIRNVTDDYEEERQTNLSAVKANLQIQINQNNTNNMKESSTSAIITSSSDNSTTNNSTNTNDNNDTQVNSSTSLSSKHLNIELMDAQTYEQYFNNACLLCNQSKYAEAEKTLRQSEKLCREYLASQEDEDDSSDSENEKEGISEELAAIDVQIGYCLQMQGRTSQAAGLYTKIIRSRPKDPALLAVACNNMVVVNKEHHLFDSKKKIRLATSSHCEHKLTRLQKQTIAVNNCIIAYLSNSPNLRQLTEELRCTYPNLNLKALLVQVTQLVKEKKSTDAIHLLQETIKTKRNQYTTTSNGSSKEGKEYEYSKEELTAMRFAIIQLLLVQGKRDEAIDVFLSLDDEYKYKPGTVSALVNLYQLMRRRDDAANLVKEAVEWYKRNACSTDELTMSMFQHAATFQLRDGDMKAAAATLLELLKRQPNDMKIIAKLVVAYANQDPQQAQMYSEKLPPLQQLTVASEIDVLETANWVMSLKPRKWTKDDPSPGAVPDVGSPASVNGGINAIIAAKKKQHRKKRRGALPKNYNADVPPDPERWLPKYERTGFRKKRDRRAKDIIKGSQGMSTYAAEQL